MRHFTPPRLALGALVTVMLALLGGVYSYGKLVTRVEQLEAFEPLSVDRRLTVIEIKLDQVLRQLSRQASPP